MNATISTMHQGIENSNFKKNRKIKIIHKFVDVPDGQIDLHTEKELSPTHIRLSGTAFIVFS
jgi:hypothetical protein